MKTGNTAAVSLWIVCLSGLGFAACADVASAPPESVRFAENIQPLSKKRCDGCHAEMRSGPMSVYSTARRFVTPGNPSASPYYTAPMGRGHPAAWGDASEMVRAWIEAGALE